MQRISVLILILVLGLGLFYFVLHERKKIDEGKNKELIESVSINDSSSSSSSSALSGDYRLRVLSEPEGAGVWVDDVRSGITPYEMPIPQEAKKIRLQANGYDTYTRQVPALRDAEGDLVWKIQLKKTGSKDDKLSEIFYKGTLKPFSIQLKAIPLLEFSPKNVKEFESKKAKFCKVELDGNIWVRILVGPFATKAKANSVLRTVHNQYREAFVTQKQTCIITSRTL
jgi:hypothetical protein